MSYSPKMTETQNSNPQTAPLKGQHSPLLLQFVPFNANSTLESVMAVSSGSK